MTSSSPVILIAGGGRGLGKAEALYLARRGARLVINDRGCDAEGQGHDPSLAKTCIRELQALGTEALADDEDLSEEEGIERLLNKVIQTFGRLDAVISNLGYGFRASVLHMPISELRRYLDLHLVSNVALVQRCARIMISQGEGGSILLNAWPLTFWGAAQQSSLAMSSAGLFAFVRSASLELRRHRVRINALAPLARTRLTQALPLFESASPQSMKAESVAPVAAYLLSPEAADVSGEIVGVAGARLYGIRWTETPGIFIDAEPWSFEELAQQWSLLARGGPSRPPGQS